jgi:hypothetical protein
MDPRERAEEDLRAVVALLEMVEADAESFDERDVDAVRADLQEAIGACEAHGTDHERMAALARRDAVLARRAAALEQVDGSTAVLRRRPALMQHFVRRQAALEDGRDVISVAGVASASAPATPGTQ